MEPAFFEVLNGYNLCLVFDLQHLACASVIGVSVLSAILKIEVTSQNGVPELRSISMNSGISSPRYCSKLSDSSLGLKVLPWN